ncbi:MAG: hypothetical protein RIS47_2369 [Bacteroidota bacterium]|jgi:serine phosphatase RsbU (regulator of sigma subunit)
MIHNLTKHFGVLTLALFLLVGYAQAQHTPQEAKLIVSRLYYISTNLTWPDNAKTSFNLIVSTEDKDLVVELSSLARTKKIKGKPYKILTYTGIDEIPGLNGDMIFLNKKQTKKISQIVDLTSGSSLLIVSENSEEKRDVMINMIRVQTNNVYNIEVAKSNIVARNIEIGASLLLIGGKEIDVKELYVEQNKILKQEKEKVEAQRAMLAQQDSEMREQKQKLDDLRKSIESQRKLIESQNSELVQQQVSMQRQKARLDSLMQEAITQQTIVNQKQIEIAEKEKQVALQQEKVDSYNAILDKLRTEVEEHQQKIASQKNDLTTKTATIESQKYIIYIVGAFLGVFVGLVFMALWAYNTKRKANILLHEKNIAISRQKEEIMQQSEEIMAQRDELAKQNSEIHQQKEEIMSQKDELQRQKEVVEHQNSMITGSIRVAQTIQNAILPSTNVMNKLFSHFSLFLPKDIVSGDFYWHTGIEEGDSRRDYIAVVDCTGHGVPGAFMSMIGSRLLNSIVNEQEIYDPAKILDRLDKSVQKALRQHQTENRDGMEVCLIRIDTTPTQRSLYFSGARRPIYLYKSETKELLKYVGSARGIAGPRIKSKLLEFETSLIDVKPNDVVYLTTDGYKDQNDMERKRLGSQAIMRAFQSIGHMPMETQCLKIQHMLEEHMNGVEQRDDITIFGVRI